MYLTQRKGFISGYHKKEYRSHTRVSVWGRYDSYGIRSAYGIEPIKDCVGVTEFSKYTPTQYQLRTTLSLRTSETGDIAYVKVLGKPSGSFNQWSGKHVGTYLAGWTSYGSGEGSRTYLFHFFLMESHALKSFNCPPSLYVIWLDKDVGLTSCVSEIVRESWKDAFSDLDEAKTKCVELMVTGNDCGGITETSRGFELRLGSTTLSDSTSENSYVLYYYITEEDFEIDITFEKSVSYNFQHILWSFYTPRLWNIYF